MAIAAGTETVGLVQQFVERTGQLYSLPAAAAEVLRLTGEPTIEPRAIKECVESDPALTARILRVVNSSLFGPSRHVTDLSQALTLLGIRPLKILVLGFSLPRELFAGLEADVLSRYWRHTLIKAVAARELSERLWRLPGDEPFLAGLVQDIGMLALIQQLGEPYQKLLAHVHEHGGPLLDRELDTLGFDHLVLSARLLAHWGLPPGLCAAVSVPPVRDRIDALSKEERTIPQMIHLAELLARLIEQPFGSALSELLASGGRYCGLTYERLQSLVAAVQEKVEDLATVLSLELPDQQSYVDMLLAARERLADESLLQTAAVCDDEDDVSAIAHDLRNELSRAARRTHHSPLTSHNLFASRTAPHSVLTTHHSHPTAPSELATRLTSALQAARQRRTPLTLVLFEIDRFSDLLVQLGPGGTSELVQSLRAALAEWTGQRLPALSTSDSQLALILSDCPRRDAVEMARQTLSMVKQLSSERYSRGANVTLSAGLATLESAPKNYPPADLVEAAQRCLTGAQLSGGDTAKSIEF